MEIIYLKRFVASRIDVLIVLLATVFVWMGSDYSSNAFATRSFYSDTNALMNIQYFIWFFLPVSFLHFFISGIFNGNTIGKSLMNLQIVGKDMNASVVQALVRELIVKWFLVLALPLVLYATVLPAGRGIGFVILYYIAVITINNASWFACSKSIIDVISGTRVTSCARKAFSTARESSVFYNLLTVIKNVS